MSRDRTRTRQRAEGADGDVSEFQVGTEADTASAADEGTEGGRLDRVGTRARTLFSPRGFLAALLCTGGGFVAGTAVVPLPGAGLLGVFTAAFLFGLVSERRRYLETTIAGGVTFAASSLVGYAVVAALGGIGLPLAAVAGGVGALAGAVGHYFGRDLRAGLTREL